MVRQSDPCLRSYHPQMNATLPHRVYMSHNSNATRPGPIPASISLSAILLLYHFALCKPSAPTVSYFRILFPQLRDHRPNGILLREKHSHTHTRTTSASGSRQHHSRYEIAFFLAPEFAPYSASKIAL